MSCRNTACGSIAITYARILTARELPDAVASSTFHELRRQHSDPDTSTPTYTHQDYQRFLDEVETAANTNPAFTPTRRARLGERITHARTETPPPDLLHAAIHLKSALGRRRDAIRNFTTTIATRTGENPDTVHQRFLTLLKNAPRPRTHRAQNNRIQEQHIPLLSYGLGQDQGVLHTALTLHHEAELIEQTRANRAPRRIDNHTPIHQPTPIDGYTITRIGVDPRNGRAEITLTHSHDPHNHRPHTRTIAYTNIDRDTREQLTNPDTAVHTWHTQLRGNPHHQYPSEHEAILAGAAPRCRACGQYASTTHTCPVPNTGTGSTITRWGSQSRWSTHRLLTTPTPDGTPTSIPAADTDSDPASTAIPVPITLPAIRELRDTLTRGPLHITGFHESIRENPHDPTNHRYCSLNGTLHAWTDNNETHVTAGGLTCTCPHYQTHQHCPHQQLIADALLERLTPRQRPRRTQQQRDDDLRAAQARAAQAAENDWTRNTRALQEAARTWHTNPETSYYNNPDAFHAAVTNARALDPTNIPYTTSSGAFDGHASDPDGPGFGLEIEFDLPTDTTTTERRNIRAAIAQALHEEGLTLHPTQQPYGTSRLLGPRRTHTSTDGTGTWVFEHDGTVTGGELVTPIMFDTDETWQRLDRATSIIRAHGGTTSRKTGLHVHTGVPEHTPTATYEELARLITQHEDPLYRLASDPHRGTHRRTKYARPNTDLPPEGFTNHTSIRHWTPRLSAVNFASITGSPNDNIEFRLFDGTLNPGAMQTHANIAVSLLAAAHRITTTGQPTTRGREAWGSHAARHKARRSRRPLTGDELTADTATTRSLLDTIFRRDQDKEHAAALFAHTRWTFPPNTSRR